MGTTVSGEEGGSGSTCGNDTYGYGGQRGREGSRAARSGRAHSGYGTRTQPGPAPAPLGPRQHVLGGHPAQPGGVREVGEAARPEAPPRVPERLPGRWGRAPAGRARTHPRGASRQRVTSRSSRTRLAALTGALRTRGDSSQGIGSPGKFPFFPPSPPLPLPLQPGPRCLLRHPEMLWDTVSTLRSPASPPGPCVSPESYYILSPGTPSSPSWVSP